MLSKTTGSKGSKPQKNLKNTKGLLPPLDQLYLHKILLFAGIAIATFTLILGLSLFSPSLRNFLHASAGMATVDTFFTAEAPLGNIFSDVPSAHKNARAISFLKNTGVIHGYEDGSFKPDATLNRAELIKLIVTSLNLEPHWLSNSFCFKDVKDEWFAKDVCYAKSKNWVQGFEDGGFHPASEVLKVEALKMILVAFEISLETVPAPQQFFDVPSGLWFTTYVWTAQYHNWLEEQPPAFYQPGAAMTRAQVAEVLFRVIFSEFPTI